MFWVKKGKYMELNVRGTNERFGTKLGGQKNWEIERLIDLFFFAYECTLKYIVVDRKSVSRSNGILLSWVVLFHWLFAVFFPFSFLRAFVFLGLPSSSSSQSVVNNLDSSLVFFFFFRLHILHSLRQTAPRGCNNEMDSGREKWLIPNYLYLPLG